MGCINVPVKLSNRHDGASCFHRFDFQNLVLHGLEVYFAGSTG